MVNTSFVSKDFSGKFLSIGQLFLIIRRTTFLDRTNVAILRFEFLLKMQGNQAENSRDARKTKMQEKSMK